MEECGDPRRSGAWINRSIVDAYDRLHRLGWAHSVETYLDGELVGGLYGVRIDRFFAGESMFHHATDASKVALVHLVDILRAVGVTLLDVQWTTPHLVSLGAVDVPRTTYLELLADAAAR
jgi:leucyl/phenylalanyl-tRNA--protein transferase